MTDRVLVTDASCFLMQTLVQLLLEMQMDVSAAVFSTKDEDELRAALDASGTPTRRLKTITASPHEIGGWAEAMDGCNYVCHNILPEERISDLNPETDTEKVRDGAIRLLRDARNEISMRRVLVISSAQAAVGRGQKRSPMVSNEDDWADVTPGFHEIDDHTRLVTSVERAMWNYIGSDGVGLELTSLLPGYTIGPFAGTRVPKTLAPMQKLFSGDYYGLPRLGLLLTHVSDLAAAHLRCISTGHTVGKRYLIADRFFWVSEIVSILRIAYPDLRDRMTTFAIPDFVVKAMGLFDTDFCAVDSILGRERRVSTFRMKSELGLEPTPGETALLEAAECMLALES